MAHNYTLLPTPQVARVDAAVTQAGIASPVIAASFVPSHLVDAIKAILRYGAGATPVQLVHDASIPAEGYSLDAAPDAIRLAASDRRGMRYAVDRFQQLVILGETRCASITDAPSLGVRGFHLNFTGPIDRRWPSPPAVRFEHAIQLLDAMSRWRLNTALIEYNDRYPYLKHTGITAPDALTREQVHALLDHAHRLDIDVIPLHQCLGHVDFIVQKGSYAHLSEESRHRDQFCPLNPDSFTLFKECIDDFVRTHPRSRFLHLGGDETRRLGACSSCAAFVARHGKGRLYADYVKKCIAHVKSYGITPIIWDDMLCHHGDVIDEIPRDVVVMYWDYWTATDPTPHLVARPENGLGVIHDKRWDTQWRGELTDLERSTLDAFSRPMDFGTGISPGFQRRFGPYFGPQFPKRITGMPYLEYYQDQGFKVIGAPTALGNTSSWHQLPDFPRFTNNIRTFCKRLHDAKAMGVVTTAWYNVPYEAQYPGLMCTGQFGWNAAAAMP